MSGTGVILVLLGAVAMALVGWLAHHVRRERLRRRQVARVRARIEHRPTVAELRERCQADSLPYYPNGKQQKASAA